MYRKAGGTRLPEDKPNRFKRTLACIVSHPLFKVFRFLIVIKKLAGCITGGGVSAIRSCFAGLCLGGADEAAHLAAEGIEGGDDTGPDVDGGMSLENQENMEALNRAADYMEANEEQMQKLLECEPDELDELIENDPELKALRDSNPLCAELMNDQATLKILVDPDNLRALGECPDLIEADFANPDWAPPEIEPGEFDPPDVVDVDADAGDQTGVEGEIDDDDAEELDLLEDYEAADRNDVSTGKAANKKDEKKEKGSRIRGYAQQGVAGLVDTVISNAVGIGLSDFALGGDDGVDALVDNVTDNAAEEADNAANYLDTAAEAVTSDEVASKVDHLEGAMDVVEDKHEYFEGKAAAAASATEGGVLVAGDGSRAAGDTKESDDDKKKKKRGAIGAVLASAATATKEFALASVLGEDLAEDIVEKMEESSDEEGDEKDKKGDETETSEKTRRWGRKKK